MKKLISIVGSAFLLSALVWPALAATARELPTLQQRSPRHDVTPRADGPKPLAAGTYTANLFPLSLRVSIPAGWRGGQGRSWQSKTPTLSFGWIVLSQGAAASTRGAMTIISSATRTPSVAAVITNLRSRGHGASYGAVTPVTIDGFAGRQFDGNVGGQGHVFVPFSPSEHVATFYSDAFAFDPGETFHVTALDVRGKTVVIFMETAALPADRFPDFLAAASHILTSLRFPA